MIYKEINLLFFYIIFINSRHEPFFLMQNSTLVFNDNKRLLYGGLFPSSKIVNRRKLFANSSDNAV